MDYNKINDEIIEKIKSSVNGRVYVGEEINEDFFHDEMPIYGNGIPDVLVDATCKEDVSKIMKICNENRIPVIARGAGSGLTGAGVAIKNGVMINMQSMNKILEFDEENLVVRVEPGVLLSTLAQTCLDKGYLYPPDPGEKNATLGGNVSLNAGGMRAVKYGTTRDYVRKMEVPKLFQNNLNPQAIEFMERDIVIASEKYIGKETFPKQMEGIDVGAYLLITFDGDDEDLIDNTLEQAAEVLVDNGAIDVLVADTPNAIRDAWAARSSFLEAIETQNKLLDECDVVVPVTKIAEYINFVNAESKSYMFDVKSFGHAGDGNLHIYTLSNEEDKIDQFKDEVDKFMDVIYKKAYDLGGKISGEHGIGHGKKKYLKSFEGHTNIEIMRGIKKAFDPNMILNPDKVIALLGE